MRDKLNRLLLNTGDTALKRRAFWLVDNLNPKKGEKILDAGCGDGFYLHLLSNLEVDITLTGADFDLNALNSAGKNLRKKIKLVRADLMKKLPFKSNSFDKVIISEVLEHLPSDRLGLAEVFRVLKPGGVVALSVPNKNYPLFWDPVNWILERLFGFHIKNGFWAGIWNQHLRLYSEEEIRRLLNKTNFKIIKIQTLTHYCLPFNHNLINLAAKILAKSSSKTLRKGISKFSNPQGKTGTVFWAIFLFDRLNDYWEGKGSAVSVVALAKKP